MLSFKILYVSITIVIIITIGWCTLKKITSKDIDLGLEMALTASAYRTAGQKTLKEIGCEEITREQLGIILILSLSDGLYQTQIANILGKDRPNITRMIDVLESKGFIRREKDSNNRRILKVFLNEKGKQQANLAKPLKDRMNLAQYKGMTDAEILTLVDLLRKVRQNIINEYDLEL